MVKSWYVGNINTVVKGAKLLNIPVIVTEQYPKENTYCTVYKGIFPKNKHFSVRSSILKWIMQNRYVQNTFLVLVPFPNINLHFAHLITFQDL